MAGSMNRATLIGHLGADPESRSFQSGGKVVNLRLATSESWTDKQTGERKDRTQWHQVAIFNEGLGKVAEQYLRKGSKVLIEGQIETRKWQDQQGQDRYTTEIVLRPYGGTLILLDGRDGGDRRDDGGARPGGPMDRQDTPGPSGGRAPAGDLIDDEIPF